MRVYGVMSGLLAARRRRRPLEGLDEAAVAVGRGLLAGLIGTAAMTVSSRIEMNARKRSASSAPVQAAEKALGVQPTTEQARERFSTIVHWSYGTGWGVVRGLVGAAGIAGPNAAALHFLLIWGAELAMLPALDVAPPPWEWKSEELAVDMLHHGVYATTTSIAYAALESS
jgi:hypothetical protein